MYNVRNCDNAVWTVAKDTEWRISCKTNFDNITWKWNLFWKSYNTLKNLLQDSSTCLKSFTTIHRFLINLHWLPVQQRIQLKILLICFKALIGQAPKYISDLLTHYKPGRNLRSASQKFLYKPSFKLKTYCAVLLRSCGTQFLTTSVTQALQLFESQNLKAGLFKKLLKIICESFY